MLLRATVWAVLSTFIFILSGHMDIAESKTTKKKSTNTIKKEAAIKGFRSAKFGMKEKDVYRAIVKDFKISKRKVKVSVNPLEKITDLEIAVPKLLGMGGTAKIHYLFGYKSKKLMQVNIIWEAAAEGSGENATKEDIVNTANFLRDHFTKKQYAKKGFIANGRVNDTTTIVFRGRDKKNRMILLVLTTPKDKNSFLLRLSYMLDFENPDIRTITIKENDF